MQYSKPTNKTFIESVLLLLLLLGILYLVFEVLRPFFGILTFALIFAVSFSTPYEHLVKLLRGKRKLTAVIYLILLLTIVAIPFIYIISTISDNLTQALDFVNNVKEDGLPPLPDAIKNLPMIGDNITSFWQKVMDDPEQTLGRYEGQITKFLKNLASTGSGMLGATGQFILGVIISAFFLVSRHKMLWPIKATMKHLLGAKDGVEMLKASEQAIKGVSIGVMGTALIAAFISWVGLAIAGIPFAIGLAAVVFFLVVIQVGPLLVWVPVIIWHASTGDTGWTIFLIAYTIGLLVIDAVLKPILIAKSGGKLPFLVLVVGVFGGMFAWGFIGMFMGAIIMAIFYTTFTRWLNKKESTQDPQLEVSEQTNFT